MEFGLGEEQRLLDERLRGFLGDRAADGTAARRSRPPAPASTTRLWHGLAEQGLPGLLVPERFGGAGLGLLDAAVAAEALGYAAAPPRPFAAAR